LLEANWAPLPGSRTLPPMVEAKPFQPAVAAPGSAAARVVPNTAPVANIETAPRRNVWREIPGSMSRILIHFSLKFPAAQHVSDHSVASIAQHPIPLLL
jgi:hypothetical protein